IYIEMSNARLALLGIDPAQIVQTLAAQNAIAAAGVFDTATDRIFLRPTGAFDTLDAVRDIAIRANNRLFRLGDVAEVSRGYVDPPQQKMRWHGREALGIGVTMVKGGDDIDLHKISLGALILSLGLLVDDAIIAVEMMAIKLEQGFDRFRAASFAYTSTAFPMLTGTLVTVAGFLPIATAHSSTGEYTRSL